MGVRQLARLTLDYTASGALDRFNRITDHAWKNSSGTALVQIKHGYDRVGNRLYREDVAATAASKSFDELYAYDGMNQLIDMQRGKLTRQRTGLLRAKTTRTISRLTQRVTGRPTNRIPMATVRSI